MGEKKNIKSDRKSGKEQMSFLQKWKQLQYWLYHRSGVAEHPEFWHIQMEAMYRERWIKRFRQPVKQSEY